MNVRINNTKKSCLWINLLPLLFLVTATTIVRMGGGTCSPLLLVNGVALPSRTKHISETILTDFNSYTFEQFLSDYSRSYYDPIEYQEREGIFYHNLKMIVQHNNDATMNWIMGINPYTDRRPEELHRGYDKYQSKKFRSSESSSKTSLLSTTTTERQLRRSNEKSHNHDDDDIETILKRLGIELDHVNDLPISVDWRSRGVTTPVKSQGGCGSCWAFASTAVLESHIAITTNVLYDLSPQEIVSCAINPMRCGGNGGCSGATAEIAFDLVQQYGIVQEWQFGYQDSTGIPINCSLALQPPKPNNNSDIHNNTYFHGAVAGITDYVVLPSNNYTVLLNTVAKLGPVAVSVACMPWHLYQSGVFYAPMTPDSNRTTDLNHLVVLEGYGTDVDTGEDYWLVRNSWGPRWGEHGYIRLKRFHENNEEETHCAYDVTPNDGTACTLDPDGNEIIPEPQWICGNSGILFDSAIPVGGYLI